MFLKLLLLIYLLDLTSLSLALLARVDEPWHVFGNFGDLRLQQLQLQIAATSALLHGKRARCAAINLSGARHS